MLFQWLPICGTSGSGSQLGQYTGASILFARRCQPPSWVHCDAGDAPVEAPAPTTEAAAASIMQSRPTTTIRMRPSVAGPFRGIPRRPELVLSSNNQPGTEEATAMRIGILTG